MISVIIPTFNRAEFLAQAIDSIVKQQLEKSKFELIVIDNGSRDNTQQVINRYKRDFENFLSITALEPGLHVGRHAGMNAAKGEILVFADDDIEALPSWLVSIEDAFKDSKVAMVGGNNFPDFLKTRPDWLNYMWHKPNFQGYKSIPSLSIIEFTKSPKIMSPYHIWGCNFSIRKEVLLKAGGFHPDGMPKDLIRFRGDGETHISRYVAKSNLKCIFHPGASINHKVTPERMTFDYFKIRGFNQGISDSYTQLRNRVKKSYGYSFKSTYRKVRFFLEKGINLFEPLDVNKVRMEYINGYKKGYEYHQQVYRNDPEVREWVHLPKYY